MEDSLSALVAGLKKATLLAGAAGTILGIVVRRQFHWVEGITAAASGVACVLFVVPAAARWGGFKGHEEIENLASFLAGLVGMYFVDFVFTLARDPWGAWERFRGLASGRRGGPGDRGPGDRGPGDGRSER